MEKYLALVFIIKESNFDRPYLIDENVTVFRKGLNELLNQTIAVLKWLFGVHFKKCAYGMTIKSHSGWVVPPKKGIYNNYENKLYESKKQ